MDKQSVFTTSYQSTQYSSQTVPPPPPPIVYSTTTNAPLHSGQHTYITQTAIPPQRSFTDTLRQAIPELPMSIAIVYCILNFILPGVGTILAGFSVLCCGNAGESGSSRFATFCINFWVGIAQMILAFFTIGWIWSIFWGFAFIAISSEGNRQRQKPVVTTMTTTIPTVQTTGTIYSNPPPQYSQIIAA